MQSAVATTVPKSRSVGFDRRKSFSERPILPLIRSRDITVKLRLNDLKEIAENRQGRQSEDLVKVTCVEHNSPEHLTRKILFRTSNSDRDTSELIKRRAFLVD